MTTRDPSTDQPLHGSNARQAAVMAFITAAAASRLLPHAPNFTAVPAMALFSGALFGRHWLAVAAPVLAMLASDLVLGATVYGADAFLWTLPVYACIAMTVLIGDRLPRTLVGTSAGALLATVTFFLCTNGCVWAFGGFYPPTATGLLICYTAALPFAANMLASSVLYGLGLFGAWSLMERRFPRLAAAA